MREILDGDPDRGVALFDANLKLVYANAAADEYLPADGAAIAGLRRTVIDYRDRLERSDSAAPPRELTLRNKAGGRAHTTISALPRAAGVWFVVRLSPPGTFSEPSVRRLQTRFRLTLREAQVATAVAHAKSNGAVAVELGISEKSVKNVLLEVFRKCRVRNRVELVLKAHDGPSGA